VSDVSPPPVVVIPARNEVGSIAAIVEAVTAVVAPGLVIVVDDQSCDHTADASREAGASVVSTSRQRAGLGAAMNLGIRTGRALGFETFLTIDADGQYDPVDLGRLLAVYRSGCADLVVGNRVADGRPASMRRGRYCANRLFSALFSAVLDLDHYTDSQSGLRVFGSRVADTCLVTNTFTAGGGFGVRRTRCSVPNKTPGVRACGFVNTDYCWEIIEAARTDANITWEALDEHELDDILAAALIERLVRLAAEDILEFEARVAPLVVQPGIVT
jgi:glycosyltransferase involved in cell wall biosynthesis